MFGSDLFSTIARVGFVVLVYGLWQGALIAFVTWGALQIFKSVNATTRYAVWSLALLAILIVPVATTLSRVHVETASSVTSETHTTSHAAEKSESTPSKQVDRTTGTSTTAVATQQPSFLNNFASLVPKAYAYCVSLPPMIFAIMFGLWLAAALVILLRLVVAFAQLERLKSDSLPLSVEFRDSMPRFSNATKGERDIRICVSDAIEVPVAVGLFDSMVLLPSHLVHSLDAEEIDQISLHELCHLLRGDDWTNALQRIAAALLFFNPAMWFISRQMDVEREVACDDFVLQLTGAVRPYAMCLTKMAEMTAWPHRPLAAPGVFITRKNISIRIERLLRTGRAIGSSIAPSAAAAVSMALLAVFFLLRTMTPSIAFTQPESPKAPEQPMKPTIGAKMIAKAPPVKPVQPRQPVTDVIVRGPAVTAPIVQRKVQEQVRTELHNQMRSVPQIALVTPPAPPSTSTVAMRDGCTGCNFGDANLSGRDFSHHNLEGSNFGHSNLRGARFDGATLTGSNFDDADLRDASFVNADMEGCNLRGAQLAGANFEGAHMTGCNIDVRSLSPEQTRIILNQCEGCNFSHANLRGMDLHGVHLTGINMEHADLRGANLAGAMFTGVNLQNSDMTGANVNGADFTGCNFAHVDLRGVDISHASLTGSDMAQAIW